MSSLSCNICQACDSKTLKTLCYCIQCSSLQCVLCERELHKNPDTANHQQLDLGNINGESCSNDPSHSAVFYCSTCTLSFCYACYKNKHNREHDKRHVLHKSKPYHTSSSNKDRDHHPTDRNILKTKESATTFTNVSLGSDENHEVSTFLDVQYTNPTPYPLQSQLSAHVHISNHQQPVGLTQQDHQLKEDVVGAFPLVNATEYLTANSEADFFRQLKCSSTDPNVKSVSIIGNTGDGKSYTLNQVFFNGKEHFRTSSTTDSCTVGVWASLDESQRTLILDTEGRLGLSQNDNIRNRLLLKILCISDIVIYRTRAPKLPNDMFQFLSDSSSAFLKYFRKELENVMKNCKVDGPISLVGPALIVFHETQFTEVLRDDFNSQKTAVEQLKERFEKMHLTYDAYSSIEYIGIQTPGGRETDFSELKATITATLENKKIRSPRRLSVIFKALKALNEKFNHAIPPEMPSTLPDDFFACYIKCLSCETKCTLAANHHKENIPHQCDKRCSYNKELDNEVWKCLACHRTGQDTVVYGKLITKDDGLIQGLLKYVWSGFVIECPVHGEIYRSRKYWYGNSEPKDVAHVEPVHVWSKDSLTRIVSDVTPRKIVDAIYDAGRGLSGPTKVLTEMLTDQIAPAYWALNKDVKECTSCKLSFGSDHSKHHCRACGQIFCDTCTLHRLAVPALDKKTPERVCNDCYDKIKSGSFSSMLPANNAPISSREDLATNKIADDISNSTMTNPYHFPISRRFLEHATNSVGWTAYDFIKSYFKESVRPSYWRPDIECESCFLCKTRFNNTTHRLHHCRRCGEGVCDACSPNRRTVPERDLSTLERICKQCDKIMNEQDAVSIASGT